MSRMVVQTWWGIRGEHFLWFEQRRDAPSQGDRKGRCWRPFQIGGRLTACYESTILLSFINKCRYTLLDPAKRYPICVAGKRRAPLEECGGPWAFMALQDEHPLFEVTAQFAQLLDHRDDLDDYREELRQLAYWIVCEDFNRQAVNSRLAAYAATYSAEKVRRP